MAEISCEPFLSLSPREQDCPQMIDKRVVAHSKRYPDHCWAGSRESTPFVALIGGTIASLRAVNEEVYIIIFDLPFGSS